VAIGERRALNIESICGAAEFPIPPLTVVIVAVI
jgi:hypothetical protein